MTHTLVRMHMYHIGEDATTYLTSSAALSAAGDNTRVCGLPFSSDDLDKSDPLGLKSLKNVGSCSSDRRDLKEDVSRIADSRGDAVSLCLSINIPPLPTHLFSLSLFLTTNLVY